MKILVVDDEALARERLIAIIGELSAEYVIAGEAANGQEAIEKTKTLQPDIVLLDIKMPGMNGLEVALHLTQQGAPPAIIFTTAYDEHALAAFEAQAISYLLKPIQAAQLKQSLVKAQQLKRGQLQHIEAELNNQRRHIGVKVRGDLQLIAVSDVNYFRADQKYIEMCHTGGMALIDESLKSLEDEFADRFIRIHRNAIVAIDAIIGLERDSLGRSYVLLDGCEEKLAVSRRHVAALRRLLKSRG